MYDLTMMVIATQFIIYNSEKPREKKPQMVKTCTGLECSYKNYFVTKHLIMWGKAQAKMLNTMLQGTMYKMVLF